MPNPDQLNNAGNAALPAIDDGQQPKGVTPKPQGDHQPTSPGMAVFTELVGELPLVGKVIKILIEKRLWGPLVALGSIVFFLVIYPILGAYLAAFWTNSGVLMGAKDTYVEEVRSAFHVREAAADAAAESNKRLDYFVPVEFSRPARDSKSFELPLAPLQRIEVRILSGRVISTDPLQQCGIPGSLLGEGSKLMDVLLNEVLIGHVENSGEPKVFQPSREVWSKIAGVEGNGAMRLTFQPIDQLRSACQQLQLEVRASVLVFKEVIKP